MPPSAVWRDPYSYLIEFTGPNILPASGRLTLPINVDREADFEIYRSVGLATSPNFRIQVRDQDDRLLTARFMPAANLLGGGQRPLRWPGTRVIRRTNQIRTALIDVSAAPNNVRVLYTGAQLYPAPPFEIPRFGRAEAYTVSANFGGEENDDAPALAANGTGEFTIRPPGDSWFEVAAMTITRTGAATLQILTNGAREWFRLPVHVDMLGASDLAGAGATFTLGAFIAGMPSSEWPFEFTPPKLLPVNSGITFRLADLSAAPNSIRITLHGVRRYMA